MRMLALPESYSSQIALVGYDHAESELALVFRSSPGTLYRYKDVAPGDVTEILFAESVGKAVRRVVTVPWGKDFTKEPWLQEAAQ